jgi:hypothetical protein
MAVFLAPTMQTKIANSWTGMNGNRSPDGVGVVQAMTAANMANGNANTV